VINSGTHIGMLISALNSPTDAERFRQAHAVLQTHLLMTRDLPIGRDFLFPAGSTAVRAAIRELTEIEHTHGKDLHVDYTQINEYFLLRIIGDPAQRNDIENYFK